MGFDVLRGNNGRCPSYLVAGLLAVCFLLICNWWSLSSQNFELLRQMDDLSEQLKVNAEELDKCINQKAVSEGRVRSYQDGAAQQRVRIEQLRATEEELRSLLKEKEDRIRKADEETESAQHSANLCTTELESLKKLDISKDSTMTTLRAEKEQLVKTIETNKEEINQLKEEISKLKKNVTNGSIAHKLYNSAVNKANKKPANENPDASNDGYGVVEGGDHDAEAAHDENKAEEVKDNTDTPPSQDGAQEDPRLIAMEDHQHAK